MYLAELLGAFIKRGAELRVYAVWLVIARSGIDIGVDFMMQYRATNQCADIGVFLNFFIDTKQRIVCQAKGAVVFGDCVVIACVMKSKAYASFIGQGAQRGFPMDCGTEGPTSADGRVQRGVRRRFDDGRISMAIANSAKQRQIA